MVTKSANWHGRKCRGKERLYSQSTPFACLPGCMGLEEIVQFARLRIGNFIGGIRLLIRTNKRK